MELNDEISDDLDDDKIIYYEKEDEQLLEYLVKYRNKSYLHCKWINYRHLIKKVDDYLKQKELAQSRSASSIDEDGDIELKRKTRKKE